MTEEELLTKAVTWVWGEYANELDEIRSVSRKSLLELVKFVKDEVTIPEEPVSNIWHNASEPPIIDKTFLLVAPNGNSSLCLWGGKELHSVTIGGGHSVLCKGDIYSYIDDLLNLDNSCNFEKNLQEEPVSEEFEKALAEEWKGYTERGAATVDALEDNTQELAFAKGFYRGSKWQKAKDESVTQDLGEYVNELSKQFPEVSFAKLSRIAVRVAKWQKEKDSELTWEDIEKIDAISIRLDGTKESKEMSGKEFYQEVLKRFKERR